MNFKMMHSTPASDTAAWNIRHKRRPSLVECWWYGFGSGLGVGAAALRLVQWVLS